jgi:class 3 adenylate cyclase/tetratricopeptide (TPR) repeat protein
VGDDARLDRLYADALATSREGRWDETLRLCSEILGETPLHVAAGNLFATALRMVRFERGEDAKFRLLSVLFVDIGASSRITTVLGPERWRRHLLTIQSVVARSVAEYEGYIHNYEGDAVLASFSFPRTHEDDARRAVLCGLNIMSKSREITSIVNAECAAEGSADRFTMRVGIDSGRVVVGPSGSLPSINAADLVGEAVNFAARLQHHAVRTGVAISDRTNAFVRGFFVTETEGPIELRSFPPQVIHHVIRSTGAEDRLQATAQRTPLVGRQTELSRLELGWERALAGGRHSMFLRGEAGVGKSRLAEVVVDLARAGNRPVLELRCSALLRATAFGPIHTLLQRFLHLEAAERPLTTDVVGRQLRELAGDAVEDWMPEIVASLVGVEVAQPLLPEALRARSIQAIVELFRAAGSSGPLLLLVEDIHEVDPSTLEVLNRLCADDELGGYLLLMTSRQSIEGLVLEPEVLEVAPLSSNETRQLVASLLPNAADAAVTDLAVRCDGIPLYAEELCLREPSNIGAVPGTLEAVLMTRLDALEADAARVAESMAVVGQDVAGDVLAELLELGPDRLDAALHDLLSQRIVVTLADVPHPTYRFRHALVHGVVYDRMMKSARRDAHARCAALLTRRANSGELVLPELIAEHYMAAGDVSGALPWWRRAGERAAATAAHSEAAEHFERALRIVTESEPGVLRDSEEFGLCLHLGLSRSASQGYGSKPAFDAFVRAHEISARLPRSPALIPALWGVWSFSLIRGDLFHAAALADQCDALAADGDAQELALAAAVVGTQRLFEGRFPDAVTALAVGRGAVGGGALLIPQDPSLASQAQLAIALWHVGRTLDSRTEMAACVAAAEADSSPRADFTRAFVFCYAAWLHEMAGDSEGALAIATAAQDVAARHHFLTWLVAARLHIACARASLGFAEESVEILTAGLQIWREAGGAELMVPYFLARLGQASLSLGDAEGAERHAQEGLSVAELSGQRFHDAELLRLVVSAQQRTGRSPARCRETLRYAEQLAVQQGAVTLATRAVLQRCALDGTIDEPTTATLRQMVDAMDVDSDNADRTAALQLVGSAQLEEASQS